MKTVVKIIDMDNEIEDDHYEDSGEDVDEGEDDH